MVAKIMKNHKYLTKILCYWVVNWQVDTKFSVTKWYKQNKMHRILNKNKKTGLY